MGGSLMVKRLVDYVHLMLCDEPHATDMKELLSRDISKCYYYLEKSVVDSEVKPSHQKWLTVTNNVMDALDAKTPDEGMKKLKELVHATASLRVLTPHKDSLIRLLERLL
jgi:hypothetical protein